jgi:nucleoside phosphorylase
LLRWNGGELANLYTRFSADPERWMAAGSCGPVPNGVHGDQVVIDHLLRQDGVRPRFFQEIAPDLLDFYDPRRDAHGPVVVFIGSSKPDTACGSVHAAWAGI